MAAGLTWSAKAGSVGAGSTSRPLRSWVTSRLRRSWASRRCERRDGVDDRVLGRQLEHDGDVAELQVGVDEDDGLLAALGQHARPGWRR